MNDQSINPVTFEVILHRLFHIAEEMGLKYMRTSGSPVLVGASDASSGICLPDGQLVAIGPYITTQANVLPVIIGSVIGKASSNPGIRPGDMFMCNDPYLGATHQPDVATVAPVHYEDEMIGWVGASGHWLDIGGPEPGGFNINAKTVWDEGLRMPPLRLVEEGVVREDIVALIMNQIREPLTELDLRGQFAANEAGRRGLQMLAEEFGSATLIEAMQETVRFVERGIRRRLRELPDGVWQDIQYLDHDGHDRVMNRIVCTVTKRGDQLKVSYEGSSDQRDGFINCSFSGLRAGTLSAMYILLGHDLPWNDGVARCLDLQVPDRSIVSAEYPAPVSMSTLGTIILSLNACFGALSKMLACSDSYRNESMATWCGTTMAPAVMGKNLDGVYTFLGEGSHFGAGCGARSYADGVNTGGIIINTTASMPTVESIEAEYPVLYLFRRQIPDSGGPGKFRGGVTAGLALTPYQAGGDLESSFAGSGAEIPNAFGIGGGAPGASVRYLRFPEAEIGTRIEAGHAMPSDLDEIDGKVDVTFVNRSHDRFPVGTVEYHNWQGGGGYGDPLERDAEHVVRDIRDSLVSPQAAHDIYGVVLRDQGDLDSAATDQLRKELRQSRLDRANAPNGELPAQSPVPIAMDHEQESADSVLVYADIVRFDFKAGVVSCNGCAEPLGDLDADFRRGCAWEELPVWSVGAHRGEDYDKGRVNLVAFYCPGCGRQLDLSVCVEGAMSAGFRLATSRSEA